MTTTVTRIRKLIFDKNSKQPEKGYLTAKKKKEKQHGGNSLGYNHRNKQVKQWCSEWIFSSSGCCSRIKFNFKKCENRWKNTGLSAVCLCVFMCHTRRKKMPKENNLFRHKRKLFKKLKINKWSQATPRRVFFVEKANFSSQTTAFSQFSH